MNEKLAEQIRNCPNLPSLPAVAVQVVELAQNVDVDITEIARVITKDPAISSKILKTVNSSFYGRSKNVSTISQALVILGLQSVRTLVLGFSLVNTLSKKKSKTFPHVLFWKRALVSATAAKVIAAKSGTADPEEAFLAALLMDIGVLALDLCLPEQYVDVYTKVSQHEALCEAERAALEADHAEVAGLLTEHWKLPPMLQTPVAFHHAPSHVADAAQRQLTEVISLAGRCADVFVDTQVAESIKQVRELLQAQYSIAEADADAMMSDIGKRTKDLASLFEINIGVTQDFEAILKKASDALVKISLHARLTKVEEPCAPIIARPTALESADTLQRFLAERFTTNALASVLLIELDEAAYIEKTFGPTALELARQFVARVICGAARPGDLPAARGNSMALAMPHADRAIATAVAEKIRKAIQVRPVPMGAESIRASVSIGIACMETGSPFRTAEHLLKAATASLAHAGRTKNCVKIFTLPGTKAA